LPKRQWSKNESRDDRKAKLKTEASLHWAILPLNVFAGNARFMVRSSKLSAFRPMGQSLGRCPLLQLGNCPTQNSNRISIHLQLNA
jgi:hypothetical protein